MSQYEINSKKNSIIYVVFNKNDYSYLTHISLENDIDASFILSLKLNGIKLHSNNIDNISELISENLDNVSEFLDTYWTEHYISVIVNGMAVYPCINNTEFNFDTSAEIIYYSNMIKKSYKSKFSTNLIFPNQLSRNWKKHIDDIFIRNILYRIRKNINNFISSYNKHKEEMIAQGLNIDMIFFENINKAFGKDTNNIFHDVKSLFIPVKIKKTSINKFIEDLKLYIIDIYNIENSELYENKRNFNNIIEFNIKNNRIIEKNNNLIYERIMLYSTVV
jgi:hypothetical protein